MKNIRISILFILALFFIGCTDDSLALLSTHDDNPQGDATDPASIWSYTMKEGHINLTRAFVHSDNIIFVMNFTEYCVVQAHNLETGELVWRTKDIGRCNPLFNNGCFLSDYILVLSDSRWTVGLDVRTGEILWTDVTGGGNRDIIAIDGKVIKTRNSGGASSVYEIDLFTGEKTHLFTRRQDENNNYNPDYLSPSKYTNSKGEEVYVFLSRSYRSQQKVAIEVYAFNLSTRETEWQRFLGDGDYQSNAPKVYEGKVYFASLSKFYCLDLSNGHTSWREKINEFRGDNFLISDNSIFLANGQVLNRANGKEIAMWDSDSYSNWVTENQNMIFGCDHNISMYDKNTGSSFKYGINFSWFGRPHPTKDMFYTSKGNTLFCLDINRMK
ncbi:MAG: hypothetical protein COA58_07470 [Bacteroidetes bacterium]|nr:MAG: hypothetical protein COA58_07470 [Bacteroidota bacterium]